MTAISTVIKKELKKAFPEIKFSATTSKMGNISVKWKLEIGTAATKNAVSEICKKHETVEHHGSNMDDTSWYSGFSVYINPTCTQERKDWAVKATEARNFVGVVWNEKHKHFQEADGRDAFHATKQYHEYCDNGVTSDLVDKYGQEPNAKRWYYERLAKETQIETLATKPEAINPELAESPKEIITPVSVERSASETDREQCVRVAKEIWPAMFNAKKVELCIENSNTLIAPVVPETNLIPFPSPQQPESEPIAQPQSDDADSFYLQGYQAWVNKLVARGEYGKIKSFDEWYAIAIEVM